MICDCVVVLPPTTLVTLLLFCCWRRVVIAMTLSCVADALCFTRILLLLGYPAPLEPHMAPYLMVEWNCRRTVPTTCCFCCCDFHPSFCCFADQSLCVVAVWWQRVLLLWWWYLWLRNIMLLFPVVGFLWRVSIRFGMNGLFRKGRLTMRRRWFSLLRPA